jgi:hypothetical protein
VQHGPDLDLDRSTVLFGRFGGVADGVGDGHDGEQTWDDRQPDRAADADGGDQGDGEQRSADGTEVVHHPLEAVGDAIAGGSHDIGEQRVAGWDAQAPSDPAPGAEKADLPHRRGPTGRCGQDCGCGVAPDCGVAASMRIVGQCATDKPSKPSTPVADPLDDPQCRGRSAQG